jgi:hypothetical protein
MMELRRTSLQHSLSGTESQGAVPMDEGSDAWFDRELAGCSFVDERLDKRLRRLVAQIGSAMGQSIPLVAFVVDPITAR